MSGGRGSVRAAARLAGRAVALVAAFVAADPARAADGEPLRVTHGPVVADVGARSAHVWARGDAEGWLRVSLRRTALPWGPSGRVRVSGPGDFTGHVRFDDLAPNTAYEVRVRLERGRWPWSAQSEAAAGRFRTAPSPDAARPVRLVFGGDLAGQNVCRHAHEGFPVFEAVRALRPDLFVGLGDMIYADDTCRPLGRYGNAQVPGDFPPSSTLPDFWAHWRYARDDPAFARLLATTPYVAVWDDHEVVNDAGPLHDARSAPPWTPGAPLLPLGLRAFLDYNPVSSDAPATPRRLYRRLRWGRHLELFVLDTRQYRDANPMEDAPALPADAVGPVRPAKSLLGREQRTWLERGLAASDATWKVVVSSVPLSIPTGTPPERGRDGWADAGGPTGFETELLSILTSTAESGVHDLVWITTDVHFAKVLRYAPFPERHPSFRLHEVVTGPMNAMVAPDRALDPTLRPETLFTHAPASYDAIRSFEEAKGWFNVGVLDVDARGGLGVRVVDARGRTLFTHALAPAAAAR